MKLGVCSELSPPVLLTSPTANSIQGPHPPMYGVCFTCLGRLHSTALLNRVESKAFCLISSSPLTDCLQRLSHCRSVASVALFYCYFHANCSSDLANCVPPLLPRLRYSRLAFSSHPYSVHLSKARVNQYSQSFNPFSGKLWNSLLASVFPPAYDLNCFKREVSRHLSHSFGAESGLSRNQH